MPPSVDTAIIFTVNMVELAAFYQEAFQLDDPHEQDRHRGFQLDGFYLGIDQDEGAAPSPGSVTLWFRVEDLEATFTRMVELGAEVRYPPTDTPWGDRLAAVFDPDGNMVGLAHKPPADPRDSMATFGLE
ncbi:MAG: VOC family protein [Acidimicrobiia bacterium]|nr:VOC family protein [Acidimicrobiia bacterium]